MGFPFKISRRLGILVRIEILQDSYRIPSLTGNPSHPLKFCWDSNRTRIGFPENQVFKFIKRFWKRFAGISVGVRQDSQQNFNGRMGFLVKLGILQDSYRISIFTRSPSFLLTLNGNPMGILQDSQRTRFSILSQDLEQRTAGNPIGFL